MKSLFRALPLTTAALAVLLLSGCGGGDDYSETDVQEADSAAENARKEADEHHAHTAPHGGELIEIGDHEYNVELVWEEPRTLVAYVLDAHAENAFPIEGKSFDFDQETDDGEETEIELTADPQDDDPEGKSSRFKASGDTIPEGINGLDDLHGHIHIDIAGTHYHGDFEDHDHDEDGDAHKNEEGHHGDKDKDGEEGHKDGDKDHKDGDKDADGEHKEGEKDAPAKDGDKDADPKAEDEVVEKDAKAKE